MEFVGEWSLVQTLLDAVLHHGLVKPQGAERSQAGAKSTPFLGTGNA